MNLMKPNGKLNATSAMTRAGRATGQILAMIEHQQSLDRIAKPLGSFVQRVLPAGPLRDALHGVPIGHPAHPFIVQFPLGAWMSAAVLDALPGGWIPATALIGAGTAVAVPAAASGVADWSVAHPEQQRVGLVHWAANLTAGTLYAASFMARVSGNRRAGKRLAFAGLLAVSVGGYLGGHLAYRQSLGANHTESVPYLVPEGWHDVATLEELPQREPRRRLVGNVPVLLYRDGEQIHAIADSCAHLSGPLHEGTITEEPGVGACVSCPWHGSTFALADGAVVHGPATAPQPRFRVRVRDGHVELAAA